MAPSNEFFVVGMADGLISMQHRPPKKTMPQEEEEASYQRTKGHGIDHKPERGDFRVPTGPRVKRSRVDALLRKYRYKEALDASIEGEFWFLGFSVLLFFVFLTFYIFRTRVDWIDHCSHFPT